MKSMIGALARCVLMASTAAAQNDETPRKIIRRIVEEIELVPSLYARGDDATRVKQLPKFSVVKLVNYQVLKKQTPEAERAVWKKNPETYTKDAPLRAAIFTAMEAMEKTKETELPTELPLTLDAAGLPPGVFKDGKVSFPQVLTAQVGCIAVPHIVLTPHPLDPISVKAKAAIIDKQGPIAQAIFQLEQVQAQMKDAEAQRDKESSKRWVADFDFAVARLETNLIFLYEYNYQIGQIRANRLPDLGRGDKGWEIAFVPKLTVPEQKAKDLAKRRLLRLRRIVDDHPGTPWAFFAQRESERGVGMLWQARRQ